MTRSLHVVLLSSAIALPACTSINTDPEFIAARFDRLEKRIAANPKCKEAHDNWLQAKERMMAAQRRSYYHDYPSFAPNRTTLGREPRDADLVEYGRRHNAHCLEKKQPDYCNREAEILLSARRGYYFGRRAYVKECGSDSPSGGLPARNS